MNKLCLLACLLVSVASTAQTAPKVVFIGDDITAAWQRSSEFTANKNWIGEGVAYNDYPGTSVVLQNFQANVINQHPAFVHIMSGFSDAMMVKDSSPVPYVFAAWQSNMIQMVAMAREANIKVILGNMIYLPAPGEDPEAISLMNAWLDQYGRANNIPVVNYSAAFCQCVGAFSLFPDLYSPSYEIEGVYDYSVTDAGYVLLTQMAQTAIATYGLTIKSGYLSDVLLADSNSDHGPIPQVNTVSVGSPVNFSAQAKWSDGVVRPMLNQDYDGLQGIWASSNPNVMYISQQGQAVPIGQGTTSISFISASGVHFSPWTMTVEAVNLATPGPISN
jgi:hypothetical protein